MTGQLFNFKRSTIRAVTAFLVALMLAAGLSSPAALATDRVTPLIEDACDRTSMALPEFVPKSPHQRSVELIEGRDPNNVTVYAARSQDQCAIDLTKSKAAPVFVGKSPDQRSIKSDEEQAAFASIFEFV